MTSIFDWNSSEYTMDSWVARADRFRVEKEKLASAFSALAVAESGGRVVHIAGSVEPSPYVYRDFRIDVPWDYPYSPPLAYAIGWTIQGPHAFGPNRMCLWRTTDWTPRYTLAYATAKTFIFIHKHEVYMRDRVWPGQEQEH